MRFQKLEDVSTRAFKTAWAIYTSSFPPDERRTLHAQRKTMRDKRYAFFLAFNRNEPIGIAAVWGFREFLFLEHLAVRRDARSRGFGTAMLQAVTRGRRTVLEVEPPTATEDAARRIRFYERHGFELNRHQYIQPAYSKRKRPLSLLLMSRPGTLDRATFVHVRERLHKEVYGLDRAIVRSG